jgi:hypothetical protein
MTDSQTVVAHAAKLVLLVVLAGVLWRGRVRHCWAFAIYLVVALAGNILASVWPSQFHTTSFWIVKQRVYDALKAAIALELAWRTFRAFPGALRTARRVLLGLLATSTAGIAMLRSTPSVENLWEWQPRVTTAALWLLTATALLVVWYQVPVSDWQRAIMLGFAVYLVVFVALLNLLGRRGWTIGVPVATAEAVAYLALVTFWAWATWRRDPAPAATAPVRSGA